MNSFFSCDFLLGQYNSAKKRFTESHFSRLVKEARVGKNMTKRLRINTSALYIH